MVEATRQHLVLDDAAQVGEDEVQLDPEPVLLDVGVDAVLDLFPVPRHKESEDVYDNRMNRVVVRV